MTLSMSLIVLTFLTAFSSRSLSSFPDHDPVDDVMINPTFDARDKRACGLFKQESTTTTVGRVYNGEQSYIGQFPWTVCFIRPEGSHSVTFHEDGKQIILPHGPGSKMSIHDLGTYEFSKIPGSVELLEVTGWGQFCTGSIIDEHWVITAAHCFGYTWEEMYFYVNAGTRQCLHVDDDDDDFDDDDFDDYLKLVVASRRKGVYKTIFEPRYYLESAGRDIRFDVALVRIDVGYILPVDTYNNEPINRICLYSYSDLPTKGCLRNVYFSGFGKKIDENENINDLKSNLTWLNFSRMPLNFCKLHGRSMKLVGEGMDCFSSVPAHGHLLEDASITDAAIRNETEVRNYPNTCPGDSGGPFIYYMKYDKDNDQGLQPGYRALLTNVLHGGDVRVEGGDHYCEKNWFSESDTAFFGLFYNPFRSVYYRTLDIGAIVRNQVPTQWFGRILNRTHQGQLEPGKAFEVFPDVTGAH